MMDFITAPLVVGIVSAGIYGLFELFVRKKERLAIIEKISDNLDASAFEGKIKLPSYMPKFSFSSLKAGCLLVGVGLGLLIGFIIAANMKAAGVLNYGNWDDRNMLGVLFGSCVLFFGGLGLVIAFIIELKIIRKDKKESLSDKE